MRKLTDDDVVEKSCCECGWLNSPGRPCCEGCGQEDWEMTRDWDDYMETKFTSDMIEQLRREYGNLKGIDPCQPTYGKLVDLLNNMPQHQLKQLAAAQIKFVSALARNRVRR